MLSAAFAVLFGLSLLPGRKPLCWRFAEKISDGIMPKGAERYCRRLTWVWFGVLLAGTALVFAGYWWVGFVTVPLTFAIELPIRRKRFQVVFRTSGSTGKSKTIIKPFETLAREVAMHRAWYRRELGETIIGETTFIGTVDPQHMYGKLWIEMLPAAMGARKIDEVVMTPEALIDRMQSAKRVFLITTPSFLSRFAEYAELYEVPQNVVEIITSGSKLPKAISLRTKAVFGIEPRQIFGSTETGGIAWVRSEGRAKVFDEVSIKAVGSDSRLAVKSPFSFRRGWYLMGDGVEISKGGREFTLLGRRDRLVKINEERVNLAEMEDKVRAMGFADCACIAMEGSRGAYLALALVAGKWQARQEPLQLRQTMLGVFPKGTVPKAFRYVDEIPKNTQGKVVTSEIAKMF